MTSLVNCLILPQPGERHVHGNVSFAPGYFERAIGEAVKANLGLALLHSHPGGRGWQGMSDDDVRAERDHAAATRAATGLPLIGLTLAGDQSWSGRAWEKVGPRQYQRKCSSHVRVVGDRLSVTYNQHLYPAPEFKESVRRTVSTWGRDTQSTVARLHVGIVGAGSVGSIVAEAFARTGVERITLIDFDTVEKVNLDRLLHATEEDAAAARSKVEVLAAALRRGATAHNFQVETCEYAVSEEVGFRNALDCDVLFRCVVDLGAEAFSTSLLMLISSQ
jgi:molybdopterin-synthase adenylyltransferase